MQLFLLGFTPHGGDGTGDQEYLRYLAFIIGYLMSFFKTEQGMNQLTVSREKHLHPGANPKPNLTIETLNAAIDRIRAFLLKGECIEDCYILSKLDKNHEYRLIVYLIPSAQFSEQKLFSELERVFPEIATYCVFVPISCLPFTATGCVDEDILGGIGICAPELFSEWEEHLRSVSGIEQIAVVEQDNRDWLPKLHLSDLLPNGEMSALIHDGQNPERKETSCSAGSSDRILDNIHPSSPAISFGGDLQAAQDAPTTLIELINRTADLWPKHGIAYFYPDKEDVFQSYAELLLDAERILAGLRKIELRPGDKVLFQFNDNRQFLTTFWGCILGGFIPVPLGVAPEYKEGNSAAYKLVESWKMLGKPVIVTSPSTGAAINSFYALKGEDSLRVHIFDQLLTGEPDHNWHQSSPEDVALIMLTSGSTGKPKGVMLRNSNLLMRSYGSVQLNGFSENDVSLNWMPLDHVAGIVYFHLRDMTTGCDQVQVPTQMVLQEPLIWLDLIERTKATITFAPNFAFGLVNNQADEVKSRSWDLTSMRFLLNGAEAIVTATARKFIQLLIPHGLAPSSSVSRLGNVRDIFRRYIFNRFLTEYYHRRRPVRGSGASDSRRCHENR